MHRLTIRLLGPFRIWCNDAPLPPDAWPTQKTLSLLKLLLTERGHSVPAERLIEHLWPGLAPGSAANSLRVSISQLRRILEPGLARPADSTFIHTSAQSYCFQVTPDCWIDLDAFWDALARAQHRAIHQQWGPAIAALQAADDLYHGDYLEEDPYAEWTLDMREQVRTAHQEGLSHLARCYAQLEQYAQAVAISKRLLRHDPLRESVCRQLMQYYYQQGRRVDALRTYQHCRRVLLEQLGVEPMPQTQDLYTRILQQARLDPQLRVEQPGAPITVSPRPQRALLPFVGRLSEMQHLHDQLTTTLNVQGRLVLIGGEPGVGKTRLVEEFLHLAHAQGAQIFHSRCYDLEHDLSYQPIRDGLRPYLLRNLAPAQARHILGPWAPQLATLVPEIRELVPAIPELPPLPPDQARQRMLEGLVQFCCALAKRYPLVLFLDDIHRSDKATLQCIHLLTRHIARARMLILGTLREAELAPGHPLTRLEHRLEQQHLVTHLNVPRLTPDAVSACVAQRVDRTWDSRAFTQRLYQETEGNPLFVSATLQQLLDEGRLRETPGGRWQPTADGALMGDSWHIPAVVRRAISSRYQTLSAAARHTLELAAVIGPQFTYDLLQCVSGLPHAELLDICDELVQRQFISEQTAATGARYTFQHQKIRTVISDELSQARRDQLQRQVAPGLARCSASSNGAAAGRLAHHAVGAVALTQAITSGFRLAARHSSAWPGKG